MATAAQELVITIPPEILGPASAYETRRLAITSDVQRVLAKAGAVKIVDSPESLEEANQSGRLLQAEGKEVEGFFKPVKAQIDAIKKPVLAAENALVADIDREKKRLGSLITTYNLECQRKREEEERRAREAAEKAAREAAEAEARRLREQQLEEAVRLEEAGDSEAAEAVLNEDIHVEPEFSPVVAQAEAPVRMAGQVGKLTYSCEVVNVKELLKAVAEGKAPMQCFILDQGWLNKKAAVDKEGFNLPGCKLKKTSSTHFRA